MSSYHMLMRDFLKKKGRASALEDPEHLHLFSDRPYKRTLGQKYIDALEAGGDLEETTRKFVDIGTRQAGATKANVQRYLERYLGSLKESGRLQLGG